MTFQDLTITPLSDDETRAIFGGGFVKIGDWDGDGTNAEEDDTTTSPTSTARRRGMVIVED